MNATCPEGPRAAGRALWSSVLASFELTSTERQILAKPAAPLTSWTG